MVLDFGEPPRGVQTSVLAGQGFCLLGLKVLIEGRSTYPKVSFLRGLALVANNKIDRLKLAVADEAVDD